jgi:hypothetical protein
MIEISDREYWKELNWYDGQLYCSLLNIDGKNDWRMMAGDDEYYAVNYEDSEEMRCLNSYSMWFHGDGYVYGKGTLDLDYWVVPVRDL